MEIAYSPTLQAQGITSLSSYRTDLYILHKETELWCTGQHAPVLFFFFFFSRQKLQKLLMSSSSSQSSWLLHAGSTGSMFSAPKVTKSRQQMIQTTPQEFPKLDYSLALMSWFYSQHRKSLLNIGKLLVKEEWLVMSCFSPFSDPSQKPTVGHRKTHWLLQALALGLSTENW